MTRLTLSAGPELSCFCVDGNERKTKKKKCQVLPGYYYFFIIFFANFRAGKFSFTWLTLLAAGFQAPALVVQRETLVARVARSRVASDATRRTGQTLATFVVRVMEIRTNGMTSAFVLEVTRFAGYTLVGVGPGARFAFSVTSATSENRLQTYKYNNDNDKN